MNKMAIVMQKVQNVTRMLFLFLSLIIYNEAKSQDKLNGKYSCLAPMQEHYNFYFFDKNGQFEYHRGASLGDDYFGQGEYSLNEDIVILNYNKTEPLKIGYHFSKIWKNNKDSIKVHFNFFNFNSVPLPYVNVIYKDSLSKNGYSGIAANEKGMASLNLKKDRTNLQFEISNLGFKQYKFTIDKNYNYSISVFLQKDGDGLPILNQIDTLYIDKKRRTYFTVKNKNGSITTWRKRYD